MGENPNKFYKGGVFTCFFMDIHFCPHCPAIYSYPTWKQTAPVHKVSERGGTILFQIRPDAQKEMKCHAVRIILLLDGS